MAWISVHEQVLGGKLRSLAKEIGSSQNEALGVLNRLWLWGIHNASPEGEIESANKEDVVEVLSIGLDKRYDPTGVVEALINTRWIDFDDGHLYIHDWQEWQKQWYKAMKVREADNERKARERERRRAQREATPASLPSPPIETATTAVEIANPPPPPAPAPKPKTEYTKDFEEFWASYPRKIGKGEAYKCYMARLKDGWSPTELLEAARKYAATVAKEHTEQKYIKHPKTFLSANTPFADYVQRNETGGQVSLEESENLDSMFAEWER